MSNSIYIAATGQHVGKTTSTLGLMAALRNNGIPNVGYCKPVGQEITQQDDIKVDKDAFLFSRIMEFKLSSAVHSPVILGPGATTAYLDDPGKYTYRQDILDASKILDEMNDLIVYEGTGHPGVGTIVGLSNADVAKMLGSSVIIVVPGGIGNTIDKLSLSISLFQQLDVPIIGVIVNKVRPKKAEKIKHYLELKLKEMGLPLLGVIPYDKSMSNPIMETVEYAIRGNTLYNNHKLANRIEAIIPGSLLDEIENIHDRHNLLMVVSYKRVNDVIDTLDLMMAGSEHTPLSGIILTGEGSRDEVSSDLLENSHYIKKHEIPVISTHLDTLGAFTKINRIEVKINTNTPWKVKRAFDLVEENVNLEPVLNLFKK